MDECDQEKDTKKFLKNKNILIIQKMGTIGGAEKNLEKIMDYFSRRHHWNFLILGPGKGPFFDRIISDRFPWIGVKIPDWRKGINFLLRYFYVLKQMYLLKEHKLDLIYVNDFFYAPYGFYLSKMKKIPCIVHVQSDIEIKRVHQYSIDKIDGVIVTTRSTFERIKSFFDKSLNRKLFLVQYGTELKNILKKNKKNNNKRFTFGIVANVLPHKGTDFFVMLLKEIKRLGLENFEIHWAGGDPQGIVDVLRGKILELNLEDCVFFDGFLQDMDSFYASTDCLIHLAQYEPFGIAMIEAMSYGIPVISTKTAGGIEILGDVEGGRWLVDLQDYTKLAILMKSLMENSEEYEKTSQSFYEKFIKNYTLEVAMKKMEDLFIGIMHNHDGVSIEPVRNW